MAVKLIASYSKRLGLPGFSSHQFSVSVETELTGVTDIAGESSRLYEALQSSVDQEIQQTGFVPTEAYGIEGKPSTPVARPNGRGEWKCSPKQKELIRQLIQDHSLDKGQIENLAQERFNLSLPELNKLQASGLIDELFRMTGGAPRQSRNGFPPKPQRVGGRQ